MSERLRQFVLGMSQDYDRAKRLTADPEAELDQTDLSPEEKQAVLSRNPDTIRRAAGLAASDPIALNAFLEPPAAKPTVRKPRKPSRKPTPRKPARKAPAKKRGTKRAPARKPARKSIRKSTRTSSRKGTRRRR